MLKFCLSSIILMAVSCLTSCSHSQLRYNRVTAQDQYYEDYYQAPPVRRMSNQEAPSFWTNPPIQP